MSDRTYIPPLPEWPQPVMAVTGLVEVDFDPITFDPVPRLRNRRNGWAPEPSAPSSRRWNSAGASLARRSPWA